MEHLLITYDLLVIMIGLAALSTVVFWAARTGESDLRDFNIIYICFTLILVVLLLKKYLFLNVEDYSARAWYLLSGWLLAYPPNAIAATGFPSPSIHRRASSSL